MPCPSQIRSRPGFAAQRAQVGVARRATSFQDDRICVGLCHAHGSIIRLFIDRAKALLRPGGVLYLVTKQVDSTWPAIQEQFVEPELFENRGYVIFRATKS